MVFAGTENTTHVPTAALVFEATRGGHWDFDNYAKLELVVDIQTGSILHEKNLIMHVDGNVSGMATESSGADVCEPESSMGMPYSKITLGGSTVYADVDGNYSVNGSGTITSSLDGQWFNMNPNATLSQNSSNPNFVHNASNSSESNRASVNAYMHSNVVRDYTLLYAPAFPTIGSQQGFNVNTGVSGTCNAFYDGGSINFYNSGGGCSNTAFSVIVHHEYGHHLVAVAGSGQDSYGEGMGDVLGVLITGDPELARGFFSDDCNSGIRTADNNYQYPCFGEIHDCGQLISGCVWDTLELMEASYPGEGNAIVSTLAINSIMLHSGGGIDPFITLDWLTLDDDDGDLDNGTPHSVEILAGFGMHSMDEIPEPPPPLDNDTCVDARVISDGSWPFTTQGAASDSDSYDESQCSGTYLGEMNADVWFLWTACNGSGSTEVSTCNLVGFDSDIVVYRGTCADKVQVACNGDGSGCGGYTSYLTFNAIQGEQYLFRVGGWSSSSSGTGSLFVDGPGDPCDPPLAVSFSYPDGRPNLVDPNGGTTVNVVVGEDTAIPADNTGKLHWNDGTGWQESSMEMQGGGNYTGLFPAFECGAAVNWYASVEDEEGNQYSDPTNAPSSSWSAMAYSGAEVIFDDDFQTDQGWTVAGDASDGQWDRGVPVGGGDRGDPATDADGSGSCYVTDNEDNNSDVDGGTTILTSPNLDASNSPILSYYRWYSNDYGADPMNDIFEVEFSINGGQSWMELETVGPGGSQVSGNWYFVEFDLDTVSGFEPSNQFRVRFVASDLGSGSVIEAGVDGVGLSRSYCDEASCTGDVNNDSNVDVTDLLEVVGAWGESGGPADVNGDGIVNVADILEVVGAWGPCP
jgi:hypothetical protein